MEEARESTSRALAEFIKERFPVAGDKELKPDLHLLESGIVDSLGILDLVAFLEEEFGLVVEDDDLVPENFASIDALTSFVVQRTQ